VQRWNVEQNKLKKKTKEGRKGNNVNLIKLKVEAEKDEDK
jgi:hypothetical protein